LIEEMKGVSDIERSVAPSTSAITSGTTKSTDDDRRGERHRGPGTPPARIERRVCRSPESSNTTGSGRHRFGVAGWRRRARRFHSPRSHYERCHPIYRVMPFVNGSGNADLEYLSDGLTETLISSLSQLPNLNVKARSSVFRYKGKETNPQTVGKELNVQAVLNGAWRNAATS